MYQVNKYLRYYGSLLTFLTVPGLAPQLILIFKSVNLMFLTLTSNRPQLPSSHKSLNSYGFRFVPLEAPFFKIIKNEFDKSILYK